MEPYSLTGLDMKAEFARYPVVDLGQLVCADFTISVLAAENFSVRAPAGDRGEHLMLPVAGSVELAQAGVRVTLSGNSNELFIVSDAQPSQATMLMRGAILVFCSFPEGITTTLEKWGMLGYQIPANRLTTSLLNNAAARFFFELVQSHAHTGTTSLGHLESAAKGLVGTLIQSNLGIQPIPATLTLKSLALGLVLDRGLDPELTVALIAERLHISVRQLQRAFATDTPLSLVLLRHRAIHAQKLLKQPGSHLKTLEQIAKSSGFSSPKTLRRGIFHVFGKYPLQVRADSLDPGTELSPPTGSGSLSQG